MIWVFDLDQTIISSTHRCKFLANGDLDLDDWRNHTAKEILQDELLPLGYFCKYLIENQHTVWFCTARHMQIADYDLLENLGLGDVKIIISRAIEDSRPDAEYKKAKLEWAIYGLDHYEQIVFFDDKKDIRDEVSKLGIICLDPRSINMGVNYD